MKNYTFRLQSVLRSRVVMEELHRSEMLAAKSRYETSVLRVADLMTAMAAEADIARVGGVVTAASLSGRNEQFSRHRLGVEAAKADRDALAGDLAAAHDVWAGAKRDLRSLERLNEQHRELWLAGVAKADQDETDEVALSRVGAAR